MLEYKDKNIQVQMNIDRLKEETERQNKIRSDLSTIIIIYSILAAYTFQLVQFAFSSGKVGALYIISFIIFIILFVISVIFAIHYIIPQKIAFKELPKSIYKDCYEQYEKRGDIKEDEIKFYVRETYLKQLEKAVEYNFDRNNKKSKYHYYSMVLAMIALIPYFLCIGIKISNNPDDVTKIELVNKQLYINSQETNLNEVNK